MNLILSFLFSLMALCAVAHSGEVKVNPLTKDLPPLKESVSVGITELVNLDNVITVTKANLQNQVKLREELTLYKDLYTRYMENTADRELLYKVVVAAAQAQKTLTDANLQHLFAKDFLKELGLFASVGEKRTVPRP